VFPQGLIKGLGITGKRAISKGVCEMYPYRPKTLPAKSRTFLSMRAAPDGKVLCTACMTCQLGCPDHVIHIERDPEDRKRAVSFTVDSGRCTFCGICEENCPQDALTFTGDFEKATYDKGVLTYSLIDDGTATSACVTVEAVVAEPETAPPSAGGGEDVG
jgi:NADH-quinone oxidoreductase subunit I